MKSREEVNYAFIDSQNLTIKSLTFFKPYHRFASDLRKKLEYKPRKKNPRKDGTLQGRSSIGDT